MTDEEQAALKSVAHACDVSMNMFCVATILNRLDKILGSNHLQQWSKELGEQDRKKLVASYLIPQINKECPDEDQPQEPQRQTGEHLRDT